MSSSYNPYAKAAGKAPPGLTQQELTSSYNGLPMLIILVLIASVAVLFYTIRIYTKIRVVRRLGWDDLLCTIGLVGALLDLVCFGIAYLDGPLGRHMWNITLGDFLGNAFTYTGYIENVTSSMTLGAIKLAIFLFYFEIFWPLKWCRWVVYIGGSLTGAFYLSMTIVQYYFMTPRRGETMAKHFGGKLAARTTILSIPTSSVGLVIDIVLFIVPLAAIFQLQMPGKKKIRLFITFAIGGMAVLGSILTIAFKAKTYGNPDLTYHLMLVNFFSCTEMLFGICIASLPLVTRATSHHHSQLSSLKHRFLDTFIVHSTTDHSFSYRKSSTGHDEESHRSESDKSNKFQQRPVELRIHRLDQVQTSSEERLWYNERLGTETVSGTAH
ncbi:MAG: hypothetical protein M1820_007061 [Bogoriella megaspora]|nr:MAG: hypothetical protein M1820_007061 [Bogoriella megaspora]